MVFIAFSKTHRFGFPRAGRREDVGVQLFQGTGFRRYCACLLVATAAPPDQNSSPRRPLRRRAPRPFPSSPHAAARGFHAGPRGTILSKSFFERGEAQRTVLSELFSAVCRPLLSDHRAIAGSECRCVVHRRVVWCIDSAFRACLYIFCLV